MALYTIGEVALLCDINPVTLRAWQRRYGLLKPQRTDGGHRLFNDDDIDRIREHSEMDDSFKAVATKIDKAFEKFGVEKFGEKGEDFDPTKHDAILHKPDADAEKETVDTVVEAGYRIGDRVIRAARVVVASPQN